MRNIFIAIFAIMCIQASWGQMISGTVSDTNGEPLPGVTIIVSGTRRGATTNFDGEYSISASSGDILQFTYIGMKAKTVTVSNQSVINIVLEEDSEQLDEVVVTAFGLEKETKSLGYAVQKVDAEELNLAGQVNPLESLQGRVAGVQINRTSGSAGGGVDILIRGVTSVNPGRDNQPLIIVDGIALNNDTFTGNVLPSAGSNATGSSEQFAFSNRAGDLNPEDIASFNVLKGAAATSLYGIRASNGAIVITTKKGKQGKVRVGVTASTTVREVKKTPTLQTTYREGNRTTKIPAVEDPTQPNGYNYYAGFSFYAWGVPYTDDSFTLEDGTVIDLSNDRFYDPHDFFRTGINTQVNFNLSGATEKLDYYFSAGRSSDQGIEPNTSYDKTNFRFKGGYKVNDKFNINSSIAYTNSGGSRGTGGDKSIYSSLSYWAATFDINDYLLPDGSEKNYSDGIIDNPRYLAEMSNLEDDVNRWVGNVTLNWKPADWANISYAIQVDNYSDLRNRFVPPDVDAGSQVGGFLVNENINFFGLESNLLATFTKDFSDDFTTTLTAGHQVSDTKTDYSFIRGEGFNIPDIKEISNTTNLFGDKTVTQLRNVGVFGDLRFEYKDKLFLSVTGRNDWISVMPPQNRSFFYPSVSMSYLFNDLIDPNGNVLTFGKLRGSWAQVGKGPNFGQIGQYFIKDNDFPFGGAGGYRASTQFGDPDLIPERNNTTEVGADVRFWNNRIRLDYSYYNTKVSDQIFPVGSAYSSGLSSIIRNAGDYETWGHELLLSAKIVDQDKFKWESIVNFSTTGGEVTAIPEDLDEIIFFDDWITGKAKVGDALGTLYGWVFQTAPNGERFVDDGGNWVVTGSENEGYYFEGDNAKVKVGNAFPDYVLSMSNYFTYKNLGLNFLVEYKAGGDLYDRGLRNNIRNGNLAITEFRDMPKVLDGVMSDGSGGFVPNTTETIITADNFYRSASVYNAASEILLQDGSWVKLRTIALSYNLPNKILDNLGVSKLSVNLNANNIILWTPFDGFDPESNQFSAGSNIYGFTGLTTPLTQNYSLGLNLEF
ncbi:SusC/RagA family TonB-linked outer membrane protein [Cytophaga sp. FL35]|uniref:SusC/RagA family TonB-linked outer membrane protein n=1 Tax=Cytophaga sp. FL35 TaxID=1904456 RepID=UPI001653C73F|nr:SusC/RagA family TonB-linked outer membrane protein [Cytophaga sp. FL35]MBC6996931.1 SusC/RagA family TonB-linked outer membrane protein [Cytophaga sp. FL35]